MRVAAVLGAVMLAAAVPAIAVTPDGTVVYRNGRVDGITGLGATDETCHAFIKTGVVKRVSRNSGREAESFSLRERSGQTLQMNFTLPGLPHSVDLWLHPGQAVIVRGERCGQAQIASVDSIRGQQAPR